MIPSNSQFHHHAQAVSDPHSDTRALHPHEPRNALHDKFSLFRSDPSNGRHLQSILCAHHHNPWQLSPWLRVCCLLSLHHDDCCDWWQTSLIWWIFLQNIYQQIYWPHVIKPASAHDILKWLCNSDLRSFEMIHRVHYRRFETTYRSRLQGSFSLFTYPSRPWHCCTE